MRMLPLLLVAPLLCAGQAGPDIPPPTVDETGMLGLINQYRAEQRAHNAWVEDALRRKLIPADEPDIEAWALLNTSAVPAGPPLVFNPALQQAARTLLAGKVQSERMRTPDFAGPMRAVGYLPDDKGVVLSGLNAPSPRLALAAAFTQVVGERMLPGERKVSVFAAAAALQTGWREAGVAISSAAGTSSVAIILGAGTAKRYFGGIVFADANRNGVYDPGEGRPGIEVKAGAAVTTSGPSGAWWLSLDSTEQFNVAFSGEGFTTIQYALFGPHNLLLDWRMPLAADAAKADKLMAAAAKAVKDADAKGATRKPTEADAERRFKALASLVMGTRRLILDEARQAKVDAMTEPVMRQYRAFVKGMIAASTYKPEDFRQRMGKIKEEWPVPFPEIFAEAEVMLNLRAKMKPVQGAEPEQQLKLIPPLLEEIDKRLASACDPLFEEQWTQLRLVLTGIQANIVIPAKPTP